MVRIGSIRHPNRWPRKTRERTKRDLVLVRAKFFSQKETKVTKISAFVSFVTFCAPYAVDEGVQDSGWSPLMDAKRSLIRGSEFESSAPLA